ncbi:MAG: class I SAM-dependent methyltransferase [Candidatus Margulisbacteria bacterium]|nr:class I SAM-dependent methyltransferase [Candidatus Margulisiibacteriota bacterium]
MKITNYNDTDYEQGFWSERLYEDLIEKYNIQKLLNKEYGSFIDIGGGFGRLVPVYIDRVKTESVLLDYSDKLLDSAKAKYNDIKKLKPVQGSFYELPFKDNNFDGGLSVRVLHHVENVPQYLKELNRVLKKDAIFILEYANKRNLLEIIRFFLGRSKIKPFSVEPDNRSDKGLTINFHPLYIKKMLDEHGFVVEKMIASSLFRMPILKKFIGQKMLYNMEKMIPAFLKNGALSPSIFLRIRKK